MTNSVIFLPEVADVGQKLLAYCRTNDWAGHDPYDALNSRFFTALPWLNFRIPRLVLTQLLKRSPVNVRHLLLIPKTQNPKGIALFLSALLKAPQLGGHETEGLVSSLAETLVALRSPDTPYWCWGYSFPWQTRTIIVPRGAPNLVCTTFVAGALLDLYEQRHETRCLTMAVSAAEYILNELYWTDDRSVASLSYPMPVSRSRIHNANFLGAALLCRIWRLTGEPKFLEPALRVARYSASCQRNDGSWAYGETGTQQWIDNFHTGYNLCSLQSIRLHAETEEFDLHMERGFRFYLERFFREDGAPGYFHDRLYPIDVHCVAQSLITLLSFQDLDERCVKRAKSVFDWAMRHMWDQRGYFYYCASPFFVIKTSYMRWSQAWMMLAIATLLEKLRSGSDRGPGRVFPAGHLVVGSTAAQRDSAERTPLG